MSSAFSPRALGRQVAVPSEPGPDILEPVPRAAARAHLGGIEKIFFGEDLWRAFELGWCDATGKPQVAVAHLGVAAASPCLIESKSLKLYLHALNFHRSTLDGLCRRIERDLSAAAGAPVRVHLQLPGSPPPPWQPLPGLLLDELPLVVQEQAPAAAAAALGPLPGPAQLQQVHSHLLRSNCPVTGQPDWGSLAIEWLGPPVCHQRLLAYIISYRRHVGFHEAMVEQIYADLWQRWRPQRLRVWAQYTRRGGLDINPWRSSHPGPAPPLHSTFRQ